LSFKQKFTAYWTEDRGLLFLLISISILIFIVYPLSGNSDFYAVIVDVFILVVLFSGVLSIDIGFNLKKVLLYSLIPMIVLGKIGESIDNTFVTHFHVFLRILFLWLIIILIFKKVFGNTTITFFYRIAGSVTIYLLIGFIWANMYFIFYEFSPDSFRFSSPLNPEDNLVFNFVYFSFVTLTTLGLGDIIPLHPFLKSLVTLESVLGPLYLAILIGRLVSKRSAPK
jgi:hypothetical protein